MKAFIYIAMLFTSLTLGSVVNAQTSDGTQSSLQEEAASGVSDPIEKMQAIRNLIGLTPETPDENLQSLVEDLVDFENYPEGASDADNTDNKIFRGNYRCTCNNKLGVAWCTQQALCCCDLGGPRCAGWMACGG
ncbi:hypothetical protein KUV28_17570 [Ferrimonas balearica]|nr:hypothetical protein [Ferrimonas balearica]